ncbi:MAG: hypothetical protein KJ622_08935 [Alphaproteobacteria bacterium]|nr:hypothetical protein [Alphaproteobacteria bacterium]
MIEIDKHNGTERWTLDRLSDFVARSISQARDHPAPFHHLELQQVFPDEIYHALLCNWPDPSGFRAMSGRAKSELGPNGEPTRVKLDLLPEYTRRLPLRQRDLWGMIGGALRSDVVKSAIVRRLEPGLSRRFGKELSQTGMYPIPILTRDRPGYSIHPHQDTHWKGITVQIYLPSNDSARHVGTIFHERTPAGEFPVTKRMSFVPNSGYAFAVGEETWHSADTIGQEVDARDSILLTYFVDTFPGRYVRNRLKRAGNFVLSSLAPRPLRDGGKSFQG